MKSFKQNINEARITIHSAMFNFMNKEIKQLMKKHDAYINSSDKTYTTISTPSASFEKDYRSLMKKHKKKIMQHFKIESSEFTERFDPRGKLDSKDFSYYIFPRGIIGLIINFESILCKSLFCHLASELTLNSNYF